MYPSQSQVPTMPAHMKIAIVCILNRNTTTLSIVLHSRSTTHYNMQEQTKTRQINAYVYYKGISNSITNKCKELNQLACIKQFDIITTYTQDSWKVRGGILNYIKYSITSTHINTEPQNVIINTNKHKYVTVANLYIPP